MSKACRNHKIPAGLFLVQEFRAVSSREFQKAHSPSSAPPDAGRLVISAPGHGVGVYDNGCAAGVTAKLQSPLQVKGHKLYLLSRQIPAWPVGLERARINAHTGMAAKPTGKVPLQIGQRSLRLVLLGRGTHSLQKLSQRHRLLPDYRQSGRLCGPGWRRGSLTSGVPKKALPGHGQPKLPPEDCRRRWPPDGLTTGQDMPLLLVEYGRYSFHMASPSSRLTVASICADGTGMPVIFPDGVSARPGASPLPTGRAEKCPTE